MGGLGNLRKNKLSFTIVETFVECAFHEGTQMDKELILNFAKQNGLTFCEAKRQLKLARRFYNYCKRQLRENPEDQSIEELTKIDMMRIRNEAAELGTELTPQEVEEAVDVLRYTRRMIRSDLD